MLEVGVPSGGCVIRNMDLFRLLVTLLVWLSWTEGQQDAAAPAAECVQFTNCSGCIQSPGCFWCAQPVFPDSRCLSSALDADKCPDGDKQDPESHINVTVDEDTVGKVQVRPHRVDAILNPGHKETFTVTVTPAPDIPLDVYILMDFSASTIDDLQVLQQIAHQIADTIAAITPNYRLGFGSFVDKPLLPYQFFELNYWAFICAIQYNLPAPCALPYSFKHSLPLVNDAERFRDIVLKEINSFNLDFPEGGFDGLAQVMACKDIIGWRDGARHIVLYLTDAGFHLAYDGKIAGVVKPNPGQCLLNSSAPLPLYYEHSEEYDFPSVAQIYSLMTENDIIPIFACTDDFLPIYEDLVRFLPGSSAISLYRNSSNLPDLIRTEYYRITHTISFVYTTVPGLSVDVVETVCPEGSTLDPDNPATCLGVEINETVYFNVTVTVTEVTEELIAEGEDGITLRIPFFEDIVFFVKPVQKCNCEDNPEIHSAACSSQGSLVCGECQCDPGFAGVNCSCPVDQTTSEALTCPTGPNGMECSGHGECLCGVCMCTQLSTDLFYYGSACECSNFNCALDTFGRRCSGNGMCGCSGACLCSLSPSGLPYTGEICDCSPDTFGCINPVDPLRRICGGVGECVCEKCRCQEGYEGEHCESCDISVIECEGQQNCELVGQRCLQCTLEIEGRQVVLGENVCNHTNCPNITFVNTTLPDAMEAYECELPATGVECSGVVYYVPTSLEDQGMVIVRTTPATCPEYHVVPAWQVAVPLVVAAIILGILLIIGIKLCVVFYDWWEYRRWKRLVEEEDHSTMENPLYEGLHREMINPIFVDAEDELEDTRMPVHFQANIGYEDDD